MCLWSGPAIDPDRSGRERGNIGRWSRHEIRVGERLGWGRKPWRPASGTAPARDGAGADSPMRRVRTDGHRLAAPGKRSWIFSFRIAARPVPDGSGVGGPLRTTGKLALRCATQHAVQFALIDFRGGGGRQIGKKGVDYVLHPRETQLARIDSGEAGGGEH